MKNKVSEDRALAIFKKASVNVPAYKDFLKRNNFDPGSIINFNDFKKIPLIDKKSYIDKYTTNELVWDGKLERNALINSSSGTTGHPYYWPLSKEQIKEGTDIHRLVYKDFFKIEKHKTLLIICFGMGTWIAGSYTLLSSLPLTDEFPMTIITPGFNKEETIKIVSQMSPYFDRLIIAGIPTFIKDLLDQIHDLGKAHLLKRKTKLLLSGEAVSEYWRDYVAQKIGSKQIENDVIGILGSAEAAVMGFETPETIKFRRILNDDRNKRTSLFKSERVPAIAAYIPEQRFFEVEKGELLITANRSIPLIRYNIHDKGGLLSIDKVKWPLVFVFGRGKFTATLYAANIYPENITMVLFDKKISKYLTGRFFLETKFNKKQDHYLAINAELSKLSFNTKKLSRLISQIFMDKVPSVNSEYAKIKQEYGNKTRPHVQLYKNGDMKFQSETGVKKLS